MGGVFLHAVQVLTREVREGEEIASEMRKGGGVDRQQVEGMSVLWVFTSGHPLFWSYVGLLAVSQECVERHHKELVPAVTQCLSQASQGLAYCGTIQSTLTDWYVFCQYTADTMFPLANAVILFTLHCVNQYITLPLASAIILHCVNQ